MPEVAKNPKTTYVGYLGLAISALIVVYTFLSGGDMEAAAAASGALGLPSIGMLFAKDGGR